MSQNRVVVWWDAEADVEQWRAKVQQQNSDGLYEAARESMDAGFRLLLRQQKIAIAAVVSYWAKAQSYFVLSAYPGLKSGAIVYEFSWPKQ